ncbi:osteocrin [Cyprinodon tularosa]|uniref:osteocrin n=1 Tax=Cyprinodon tularosa TaxID=77115 RepID=UPI0018E1ED31|nr:osteocrin [Cyprinodon tularosa]
MQSCSRLQLIFCLLSITVLHCSVHGVHQLPVQHRDRPGLTNQAIFLLHSEGMKPGEKLLVKLLQTDDLMMIKNNLVEPKRKRRFPGNSAPLDRLSMGSMENRQGKKKQSKVVESQRRRENPPPIDRVGMSRLPKTRG